MGYLSILVLGGIAFYYMFVTRQGEKNIFPQPTPSPTISTMQEVDDEDPEDNNNSMDETGEITNIIGSVDYKNSLLLQVNETNIYVTPETEIEDNNGESIARDELEEGDRVIVQGIAAEGGIEALNITVLSEINISPTSTEE